MIENIKPMDIEKRSFAIITELPGDTFTATKPTGKQWNCAVSTQTLYAGYPHFHFYANPAFAESFIDTCIKEKHRHD